MPTNRERQRVVREGVEQVLARLTNPDFVQTADEPEARAQNLAEVLALLAANARATGSDEALLAEIMLRVVGSCDRDTLLEARRTMAALGYDEIAAVLKRLARPAPRRVPWFARITAKSRERVATLRNL